MTQVIIIIIIIIIYSFIKMQHKMIGERDMQGSVIALKAAPKLHNYDSTRNRNSDTQKYTHTHTKNIYTP